jgi:S-formylglutathione hydrolase FrmB
VRETDREGRRRALWERVTHSVDNLTTARDPAGRVPTFITVALQNGGNDTKGSQRNLEYDTMSDRLARFIHDEILPAVLADKEIRAAYPRFALTEDPDGRAVFGCSSGGAAALTMGWFRPEWFRRIITYSGTFVENQDEDRWERIKYPFGAWEYHSGMKLIETSPKKPLRVFTHVSEQDNRYNAPEDTHFNWVTAGYRTAEALAKKGYDQRFVFSKNSGHCEQKVYDQTLPDAFVWAWQGYRPARGR